MQTFLDHPYMRQLLSLQLPRQHYVIAGSGPLFARGWVSDPSDIDVVARGPAWEMAVCKGEPTSAPYSDVQRVSLFQERIEILNGWFPEWWSVDQLIDGADVLDGIRFLQLAVVYATKRKLGRPRDMEHLKIMKTHGYP